MVGITGPVGSGKTTLAGRLAALLSAPVISTDSYLPDYANVPELERDFPEHTDLPLVAEHLGMLRAATPATIPMWSFHTHRREGSRVIAPAPVIIVEGIHALHSSLTPHLDLRIYVEAPAEIRWSRWEQIESRGERGMGIERAREHFTRIAEPTFERHASGYRASAHVVVLNPGN
jgi:uridine kinase